MIGLHHTHLMASDLDATIAFWRDGFGGEVVHDVEFAGARNVFLRVGSGRIHLYDQPPKTTDRGTVHHLGVVTDELEHLVERLRALGHSVTDIRREPTAAYAMAEGPDHLLVDIFQPDPTTIARRPRTDALHLRRGGRITLWGSAKAARQLGRHPEREQSAHATDQSSSG